MGLLDYYKQFEGMPEDEYNEGLREQAQERRRKERKKGVGRRRARGGAGRGPRGLAPLTPPPPRRPEPPPPHIVTAIPCAAARGLPRSRARHAGELQSELAHRHDIDEGRLAVG